MPFGVTSLHRLIVPQLYTYGAVLTVVQRDHTGSSPRSLLRLRALV